MKRKVYENPPLVEVAVEFWFITRNPDITVPGRMYEKLRDKYPGKTIEIPLSFQTRFEQGKIHQEFVPSFSIARFFSEDQKTAVRVGPDFLGINLLKNYSGWEDFKKMIINLLKLYMELAEIQGVREASLKYVNALESDELLNFRIKFPTAFQEQEKIASALVQVPYQERQAFLFMHLMYHGEKGVILSLGYEGRNVITGESLSAPDIIKYLDSWLEEAHSEIENAFEESITDKARETFKVKAE